MIKKLKTEKNVITKLKKAADSGDANAMYRLGRYYESGNFVILDINEAKRWYREAIKNGNIQAIFAFAHLERKHARVQKVDKNLLELYRHFEEINNASIQNRLGMMYRYGEGVEVDHKKANKFFDQVINNSKCDDEDLANALAERGHSFFVGLEEKKDHKRARALYEKAGQKGNLYAKYALACIYYEGLGVDVNYVRARELLSYLTEDVYSLNMLAEIYYRGLGITKNPEKAKEYMKKSKKIQKIKLLDELLKHEIENRRLDLVPILVNELYNEGKKEYEYYVNTYKKIDDKRVIIIDSIADIMEIDLDDNVGGVAIFPKYNIFKESHTVYDIETIRKLKQKTEIILSEIPKVKPDKTNEMEVFEQICKKVAELIYNDFDARNSKKEDSINRWFTSRNLIGALLEGRCVCAGYAELLRNLCACRGIECNFVISNNHAFNQVKINGKWYWFDLTNLTDKIKNGEDIASLLLTDEEWVLSSRSCNRMPYWNQQIFCNRQRKICDQYREILRVAFKGIDRATVSSVIKAEKYINIQLNRLRENNAGRNFGNF